MRSPSESNPPTGRLALWPNMDLLSSDRLLWHAECETAAIDLVAAVRAAVADHLTKRQRQVVEGYFFEGVSQPDLALKLGVSQQVIHKCIYGTQRKGVMVGGALKKLHAALAPLLKR